MIDLKKFIRDCPNFPKKGIIFKDITPLLLDKNAFSYVVDQITNFAKAKKANLVAAVESRGFIIGGAVANKLGVGFVPVRKMGKLPYKTIAEEYELEYGKATVEIHSDAVKKGDRVILIDDLLATGGTALASCKLIEKLGGTVCGIAFIVVLEFLSGREKLSDYDIFSLTEY